MANFQSILENTSHIINLQVVGVILASRLNRPLGSLQWILNTFLEKWEKENNHGLNSIQNSKNFQV